MNELFLSHFKQLSSSEALVERSFIILFPPTKGDHNSDQSFCNVTFRDEKDCLFAGEQSPSQDNTGAVITKEGCVGNSWSECFEEDG